MEYLTVKDHLVLWNNLKDRYDHLKLVVLPHAHFKSISEYNSSMFRIISQLKLCGQNITDHDILEKTFSTFPASKLISHLLVAEQHNDLLVKNHESRPTGSMLFLEVNMINFHQSKRGKGRGPSCGHGRGRGINFNHGDRLALNNNLHH
ncbi:hypothetical protein R3W88_019218 [Solanum pinnatisectum]|uniref:Uncharacterized protein n=1 Tax=Solanum pinnatisectum TaxID=50273 RepID=A0AAV9KJ36_9SOLN|nr:hypothetical protein R3W88_019218 [Solanum pinnatisectum]